MSAVGPGALVMTCERYLPRPSCVMPRSTLTPRCGTSANLMVLFGPAKMASLRSLPDLVGVDVERRRELDVADVIAAEVDVHQTGNELVVRRRPCRYWTPWTSDEAQLPTPMIATRHFAVIPLRLATHAVGVMTVRTVRAFCHTCCS